MGIRNNNLSFFFIFFTITFLIIFFGKVGIFSGTNKILTDISWKITSVLHISNKQNSELQKLTDENSNLKKKLLDQQEIIKENKALRDQFSTTSINPTTLIPAKVVGSPGFIPGVSNPDYLVIDKGTNDGITVNDAVVYQNNLVGKIVSISNNYSKIKIAINLDSFTAKIMSDKEIAGVITGKGNILIVDNVLLSEKLSKDQIVLTKGDVDQSGAGIPPDLVIGKVISVEKKSSDLFQRAEVKSDLDFRNLSTVFVIKR